MQKITLTVLDTCLSDYFQGCSPDRGIVLAVSVSGSTTRADLIEGIIDDWNGSDFCDDRFDDVTTDDMREAANYLTRALADNEAVFTSLEKDNEEEPELGNDVYCYVLVNAPETD